MVQKPSPPCPSPASWQQNCDNQKFIFMSTIWKYLTVKGEARIKSNFTWHSSAYLSHSGELHETATLCTQLHSGFIERIIRWQKSSLTLWLIKAMLTSHHIPLPSGLMPIYWPVFFPLFLLILLPSQVNLGLPIYSFCCYRLTASHPLPSAQAFVRSSSSMTVMSIIIMIASLHADSADLPQEKTRNVKLNPKQSPRNASVCRHLHTCFHIHVHTQT